ncbi:MAG: DUF3108 domain-containing protein [Variovorax sp.]|nr:MAG: DUF3108 domain-containing protein [Variovorax sp.]
MTSPFSPDSNLLAPPETPGGRGSWRAIAVLTAAVVLAHGLLLGVLPMQAGTGPAPATARFEMRTIVAAAPGPASAPATPPAEAPRNEPVAPVPVRKPVQRPAPKPRAVAPAATPTPARTPDEPVAATPASAVEPSRSDEPTGEASPQTLAADVPPGARAVPAAVAAAAAPPPSPTPAETRAPAPAPLALDVPRSVDLKFNVSGQQGAVPLQGVVGELTWSQDGRAYDARLTLRFLFKTLRTQHSSGAIGPTGIEPTRFSDTRKTEVASHFVRDQGQVVFSSNAPTAALMAGAQDRLSVMLQLGALLAGDPARYPADGAIAVQTVGPRDADIWIFKIGEEERLELPAGDTVARKLTRNPRMPFDDTVELWLAPSMGYLPVRIRITQPNGDFADMQLRSAS